MPRITYLDSKTKRIETAVKDLIRVGRVIKGYADAPTISEKGFKGLKTTQARAKLNNPEKLTLEELVQIGVAFDIPCEDILAKIMW